MSIGQVIKVVREERGLTQSQFAHELFVTQQALSRWEKGTAEPSIDIHTPLTLGILELYPRHLFPDPL